MTITKINTANQTVMYVLSTVTDEKNTELQ